MIKRELWIKDNKHILKSVEIKDVGGCLWGIKECDLLIKEN